MIYSMRSHPEAVAPYAAFKRALGAAGALVESLRALMRNTPTLLSHGARIMRDRRARYCERSDFCLRCLRRGVVVRERSAAPESAF
jgi:hypothetical protein